MGYRRTGFLATWGMALALVIGACGGGPDATTAPSVTSAPTATSSGGTTPGPTAVATATPRPTATIAPTATPVRVPTGQFRFAISNVVAFGLMPGVAWQRTPVEPMFDAMVGLDAKGVPVGDGGVVTSWTSSADAKTWTFKVHNKAVFHDGQKVTAQDVKYSLDYYASDQGTSTGTGSVQRKRIFESATAPDDTTVVVVFKAVSQGNLFAVKQNLTLAGSGVSSGFVLPKHYVEKIGVGEANKKPIGSGPFKITNAVPDQNVVMEAVSGQHWYYGVPQYRTAELKIIPEDLTRTSLLKTGGVEATDLARAAVAEFQKGNFDVVVKLPGRQGPIQIHDQFIETLPNGSPNPFANAKVRQALSLAIDRQVLVNEFLLGLGTPKFNLLGEEDPAYKARPVPKQDIAAAKKLLAEAGFANGFEMLSIFFPLPGLVAEGAAAAEAVNVWWEQLGIKVSRSPMETTALFNKIAAHKPEPPMVSMFWWAPHSYVNSGTAPGSTPKDSPFRQSEDQEVFAASRAVYDAVDLQDYVRKSQAWEDLMLSKMIQIPGFSGGEYLAVRKGFGGDKWRTAASTFGINITGLYVGTAQVR